MFNIDPIALDNSLAEIDQETGTAVDPLSSNTPSSAHVVISCPPTDVASVNVTGNVQKLSLVSTIADLIEFCSAVSPPVKGTSGSSLTTATLTSTTDGVIKSHVSPIDIRPFPQVSQSIQNVPRKKTNSRAGSAKILTDTPEKNKIELEHKNKQDQEMKKNERKEKMLAKRAQNAPAKNKARKKTKISETENCSPDEIVAGLNVETDPPVYDEEQVNGQHLQPTPPCRTRAGRIVRRKIIDNV